MNDCAQAKHRAAASALALVLCLAGATATAETLNPNSRLGPGAGKSERVVSQGEWALNLVDALGLKPALADEISSEDVFGLLCPTAVERMSAAKADGGSGTSGYQARMEVPTRKSPGDPVRMTVSLASPAVYMLSVEGAGPQRWVVNQNVVGHVDPTELGVAQATAVVPLRRGPHEITGYLAHDSKVESVELAAYRPLCIAPAGGWRADRPLTHGDRARTIVRALGIEQRLPESGEPILVEAESYVEASPFGERTHRKLGVPASAHTWVTADGSQAEFTWRVRIDDPSVFTVEGRLHGEGPQIWSIDGRHRVTVKPGDVPKGISWSSKREESPENFVWADIVTLPLAAGEHVIRALIPTEAGIDQIRLVRRKSGAPNYLNLIEEAGFRGGAPAAYVTRAAAYRSLSNPTFVANANFFLDQVAGRRSPILLVEYDTDSLYSRPRSPLLPPEL
jgi:hypothetical protein